MSDMNLIEGYQEKMRTKKKWGDNYELLIDTWQDFCDSEDCRALQMRIGKSFRERLMTRELCTDWDKTARNTGYMADDDIAKLMAHNLRLADIAKHLGRTSGCEKHPWEHREQTLSRVGIRGSQRAEIWPEQGEWKRPDLKLRLYQWDTYTDVLMHALLAFSRGDIDVMNLWLHKKTSGLIRYCKGDLRSKKWAEYLVDDGKDLSDPKRKNEVLQAFSEIWKVLSEEVDYCL
jgi:hypothetical protein